MYGEIEQTVRCKVFLVPNSPEGGARLQLLVSRSPTKNEFKSTYAVVHFPR